MGPGSTKESFSPVEIHSKWFWVSPSVPHSGCPPLRVSPATLSPGLTWQGAAQHLQTHADATLLEPGLWVDADVTGHHGHGQLAENWDLLLAVPLEYLGVRERQHTLWDWKAGSQGRRVGQVCARPRAQSPHQALPSPLAQAPHSGTKNSSSSPGARHRPELSIPREGAFLRAALLRDQSPLGSSLTPQV